MNRNKARAFLLRYREQCERVRELENEAEEILTRATRRTANPDEYDNSKCYGDKVGNGAATLAILSERIAAAKAKRLETEREIFFVIDRVQDGDVAEILDRYYLECMTLASIADVMGRTERWTQELHKRGLDEVARLLANG